MLNNIYNLILRKKLAIIFVALVFIFVPTLSHAATLTTSPSTTSVNVDGTFTLRVNVNTSGKAINNSEAVLQFPVDLLKVLSVTRSSSMFSLWVEEPTFSNSTGTISFNGGSPNPGYTGGSGQIVSITFKAKKQGTANITFLSGAVRENDGLGTDILTSKNGSVIQINIPEKIIPVEQKKVIEDKKPSEPKVEEKKVEPEVKIEVKPVIYSLPKISLSSKEIKNRQSVVVFGTSEYVNTQVSVVLEQDGKVLDTYITEVSSDGFFSVTTKKIQNPGTVYIKARNLVSSETNSDFSEKLTLNVLDQSIIKFSLNRYLLIYSGILLLLFILFLAMGWYKYFALKRKIKNIDGYTKP